MLTPTTKRNIKRIIPFGVIWLVSGWVFLIVESAASENFQQLPSTSIRMDFQIFFFSSIALAAVGLLTGVIELKYLDRAFARKRFATRFLGKFLIYTLLFFIIVLITFPVAASLELDVGLFHPKVWEKYLEFFKSMSHLSTGLQLATALIISLFYSEISEFIGQNALISFFTGKYHEPVEEERIFMFLDMKSSTTIAEKLGHQIYFNFLREYYNCFTRAIIAHGGEIYQYVGDEIILSWKVTGNEKDNRCIDCFFAMKESLNRQKEWFMKKFGFAPEFKAGIHLGKVTTGEIGVIKKEILFSGDVLNATARMQGLCNSFGVDLILSDDMTKQLKLSGKLEPVFLGEVELRGKEEKKKLYTVNRAK